MTLQQYLSISGKGVRQMADDLGVRPATVYRWLQGQRIPNPAQMRSIHRTTYGCVTPNDLVLE